MFFIILSKAAHKNDQAQEKMPMKRSACEQHDMKEERKMTARILVITNIFN